MLNKFKTIFFLGSFITFIILTISYYFSDKNIYHINKLRSTYTLSLDKELPLLKNDTKNIIVYKNDLEEFKKKRKKRFWEKLLSNDKK